MDYSYRMNALTALREALVYYEAEIYQALVDDLNKSPYETSISEYGLVLRQITYVESRLKGWMKPRSKAVGITGLPGKAYELVEPYGIVLIISPWNYPLSLTMQPLIGAIAAGNCCIIKPSELSPHTSDVLVKIISRAFPEKYIAMVLGGKSPCIVTVDADVREAAKNIAYGKTMNSGQVCIAPDYALVDEKVKEQ